MSGSRIAVAVLAMFLLSAGIRGIPWVRGGTLMRSALIAVALVLLVLSVFGISRPRAAVERSYLVVTKSLVDVGGYRLRLERKGSGSPTVVMDAGLCQPMGTWGVVPEQVSKFTRTVMYDRAGVGGSDRRPGPSDSQQIVEEMDKMLAEGGIRGPYVLVGHSFGGLNVRLFASRHPGDVTGMVLVDASHEDQYSRIAALLPPEEREGYLRHESGENCEQVDLLTSGRLVRAAERVPTVPLVVLSAHQDPRITDPRVVGLHDELQGALAQLIPNSIHTVVDSGHFIQHDRPELVIDAIRRVVDSTRRNP